MFSKELENLIQATLEDGILEDNEKAALVKRAQREGVDIDELDIYINSLLQRRQRELNEKKEALYEKYEKEKKEAIGPVCPKCHKQMPPLTLKCDCGYEFTSKKSASSVQSFFEQINNISLTEDEIESCSDIVKENDGTGHYKAVKDANGKVVKKLNEKKVKELKQKKTLDIISSFPVPNTKEDIVEFLSLAAPNAKKKGGIFGTVSGRLFVCFIILIVIIIVVGIMLPDTYIEDVPDGFFSTSTHQEERQTEKGAILAVIAVLGGSACVMLSIWFDSATLEWNKTANVWKAKFDQVIMKGRSLRGDVEFQKQLDYYDTMINPQK